MANWISSKLKVAETFLEQIDLQAAESLKKNERSIGSEGQELNFPAKTGGDKTVSLKDQFKKKSTLDHTNNAVINDNNSGNVEFVGKLNTDPSVNNVNCNSSYNHSNGRVNEVANISKPKSTLTDSDWTELLSTPTSQVRSNNRSTGSYAIRGLRKDVRKQGISGSGSSLKNNVISRGVVKTRKGLDVPLGDNKLNGKLNDEIDDGHSSSSARSSNVEMQIDGKGLDREDVDRENIGVNLTEEEKNKGSGKNAINVSAEDLLLTGNKSLHPSQMSSSVSKRIDGVSDVKKGVSNVYDRLRRTVNKKDRSSAVASGNSTSDGLKKGSSTSGGESDTDSDSVSTSDSENEREREMREKILAEKAAAKAVEAIKERENTVARLEGEKQSLEKILEERAKQQAQEALELQTTTMETMEAVELEKQKHNNTRMEALARLAKLETTNADLARSFATAQKNLEIENHRVAELRQQLELKEASHEDLRRNIFKSRHTGTFLNKAAASRGVEFEREILEAEYSFLTDKIAVLEDKAKKLEENIEMTRKDMEDPTEVEIELKRRLSQLTDHLIQKQAQVEALSSEKATLLLRIEAVSRLLDENGSNSGDLESGTCEVPDSKLRPLLEDKIRSGRKHLGSLVKQLDSIFMAGAVFVRRNPAAKLWSVVYLFCLHVWVLYIFLSHSQVSDEGRSGAVISLENINQTAGV